MNLYHEILKRFYAYLPWGERNKRHRIEEALIRAIAEVMEREIKRR